MLCSLIVLICIVYILYNINVIPFVCVLARKFGSVFRYIDDLLALNDGHSFETHYKEIYPEELELCR